MTNPIAVMIVDDNSQARRALASCLSHQPGVRIVAQASNGLETIRLIPAHMPDIIVLDMFMPIMDGLETTKIIKEKWPKIKIVILTMYPDYQYEALASGADAFMIKGDPFQHLMDSIRSLAQPNKVGSTCA